MDQRQYGFNQAGFWPKPPVVTKSSLSPYACPFVPQTQDTRIRIYKSPNLMSEFLPRCRNIFPHHYCKAQNQGNMPIQKNHYFQSPVKTVLVNNVTNVYSTNYPTVPMAQNQTNIYTNTPVKKYPATPGVKNTYKRKEKSQSAITKASQAPLKQAPKSFSSVQAPHLASVSQQVLNITKKVDYLNITDDDVAKFVPGLDLSFLSEGDDYLEANSNNELAANEPKEA